MKTLQLTLTTCFIAVSMLAATASRAGPLPDYYPKTFDIIDTLDGIDTHSQALTIGDRSKRYDASIKVHTPNNQFSSLDVLRPGMKIGASLSGRNIMEIWVLPNSYKPPSSR